MIMGNSQKTRGKSTSKTTKSSKPTGKVEVEPGRVFFQGEGVAIEAKVKNPISGAHVRKNFGERTSLVQIRRVDHAPKGATSAQAATKAKLQAAAQKPGQTKLLQGGQAQKAGIKTKAQLLEKLKAAGIQEPAKQLDAGIKAEMEHTKDKRVAQRIAMDHLAEIPDYYNRLQKMEKVASTAPATKKMEEMSKGDPLLNAKMAFLNDTEKTVAAELPRLRKRANGAIQRLMKAGLAAPAQAIRGLLNRLEEGKLLMGRNLTTLQALYKELDSANKVANRRASLKKPESSNQELEKQYRAEVKASLERQAKIKEKARQHRESKIAMVEQRQDAQERVSKLRGWLTRTINALQKDTSSDPENLKRQITRFEGIRLAVNNPGTNPEAAKSLVKDISDLPPEMQRAFHERFWGPMTEQAAKEKIFGYTPPTVKLDAATEATHLQEIIQALGVAISTTLPALTFEEWMTKYHDKYFYPVEDISNPLVKKIDNRTGNMLLTPAAWLEKLLDENPNWYQGKTRDAEMRAHFEKDKQRLLEEIQERRQFRQAQFNKVRDKIPILSHRYGALHDERDKLIQEYGYAQKEMTLSKSGGASEEHIAKLEANIDAINKRMHSDGSWVKIRQIEGKLQKLAMEAERQEAEFKEKFPASRDKEWNDETRIAEKRVASIKQKVRAKRGFTGIDVSLPKNEAEAFEKVFGKTFAKRPKQGGNSDKYPDYVYMNLTKEEHEAFLKFMRESSSKSEPFSKKDEPATKKPAKEKATKTPKVEDPIQKAEQAEKRAVERLAELKKEQESALVGKDEAKAKEIQKKVRAKERDLEKVRDVIIKGKVSVDLAPVVARMAKLLDQGKPVVERNLKILEAIGKTRIAKAHEPIAHLIEETIKAERDRLGVNMKDLVEGTFTTEFQWSKDYNKEVAKIAAVPEQMEKQEGGIACRSIDALKTVKEMLREAAKHETTIKSRIAELEGKVNTITHPVLDLEKQKNNVNYKYDLDRFNKALDEAKSSIATAKETLKSGKVVSYEWYMPGVGGPPHENVLGLDSEFGRARSILSDVKTAEESKKELLAFQESKQVTASTPVQKQPEKAAEPAWKNEEHIQALNQKLRKEQASKERAEKHEAEKMERRAAGLEYIPAAEIHAQSHKFQKLEIKPPEKKEGPKTRLDKDEREVKTIVAGLQGAGMKAALDRLIASGIKTPTLAQVRDENRTRALEHEASRVGKKQEIKVEPEKKAEKDQSEKYNERRRELAEIKRHQKSVAEATPEKIDAGFNLLEEAREFMALKTLTPVERHDRAAGLLVRFHAMPLSLKGPVVVDFIKDLQKVETSTRVTTPFRSSPSRVMME